MRNRSDRLRRSGCPVGLSLDIVGDRWSFLIIRDLMVRGYRTFSEFRQSGEGIATNILSERLKRLEESGILTAEADAADARRITYRLTEKGIGLAPVVLELLIWGAKYEDSAAPGDLEQTMGGKSQFLEEVRRRWREDDRTPLLPAFRETDKLQERNR